MFRINNKEERGEKTVLLRFRVFFRQGDSFEITQLKKKTSFFFLVIVRQIFNCYIYQKHAPEPSCERYEMLLQDHAVNVMITFGSCSS
jgi:hypothetical protein